jgi:hypothetical protein
LLRSDEVSFSDGLVFPFALAFVVFGILEVPEGAVSLSFIVLRRRSVPARRNTAEIVMGGAHE